MTTITETSAICSDCEKDLTVEEIEDNMDKLYNTEDWLCYECEMQYADD